MKNFAKFTRKHLWCSFFFEKFYGRRLQLFRWRSKTSVIKLPLKQVSFITIDEYLYLKLDQTVLHCFAASSASFPFFPIHLYLTFPFWLFFTNLQRILSQQLFKNLLDYVRKFISNNTYWHTWDVGRKKNFSRQKKKEK